MKERLSELVERLSSFKILNIRSFGGLLILLSIGSGYYGYLRLHPGCFQLDYFIEDFYANISTELASIAITVLVIDALIQLRESEREKKRLIRLMRSRVNSIATGAAGVLRARGWLFDGSLDEQDFDESNLQKAAMYDSSFIRASMARSKLQGIDLTRAHLSYSNFTHARLDEAKLYNAILNGGIFQDAILLKAHLNNADLREADLSRADLTEAGLFNAKLQDAILCDAVLIGAHLNSAKLNNADLSRANFEDARLYNCVFQGAKLLDSNLQKTYLNGVIFDAADLSGANLKDVKYINHDRLKTAHKMRCVTMPDGKRYDGRYNLPGDIEEAIEEGIDIRDKNTLAKFYGVSIDKYLLGQDEESGNQSKGQIYS